MSVTIIPPGAGRALGLRGADMRIKAGLDDTGPELTVVESNDPEGFAPAPHRHHASIEAFYVLEGRYSFTTDEGTAIAEPGAFVLVPTGVTHSYVVGPGEGRILIFYAPAGVERFWRAMGEAAASGPVSAGMRDQLAADLIATEFD